MELGVLSGFAPSTTSDVDLDVSKILRPGTNAGALISSEDLITGLAGAEMERDPVSDRKCDGRVARGVFGVMGVLGGSPGSMSCISGRLDRENNFADLDGHPARLRYNGGEATDTVSTIALKGRKELTHSNDSSRSTPLTAVRHSLTRSSVKPRRLRMPYVIANRTRALSSGSSMDLEPRDA